MNQSHRVMLLIDADNVSVDVMEHALQRTMAEHGAVHVRRAYCNAEMALKHQAFFKRFSIRPMVNLSAGKNSTDIALAVDALDLVLAERPDLVVLVSSDSDFAPLVIRLREKGCRVCGIGQEGKTGEETKSVYDAFIDLPHKSPAAASPRRPAPSRTAARASAPAPAPAPVPASSGRPVLPDEVQDILDALPELRRGERMELNQAATALREEQLLGRNASSLKLFRKHPEWFVLTPAARPSKVEFLGG
ncbi:NYN domain-containing protein [Caenimonas aquaedulcis]|uniref:NYN domain-containing protein n=1 Tax=Caenimonas aquaedulcis TaxID=2793270 RepID=A0A931H7N8_9BURK|nr:NYN domain-containing protein [Caenimonas aquaedulcis]MBG9389903.1 NYN domain-containing protein [Caenimonas aquaedulcis]